MEVGPVHGWNREVVNSNSSRVNISINNRTHEEVAEASEEGGAVVETTDRGAEAARGEEDLMAGDIM